MLSNFHCQRYQQLKQALAQMQQALTEQKLDSRKLQQCLQKIQQSFQEQILRPDAGSVLPVEPRVVSYQTEISKQLRLLGIDLMFLQAARQQQTIQQRQTQLDDRLQVLIGYCDALGQLTLEGSD